jgi:hypothetical protein
MRTMVAIHVVVVVYSTVCYIEYTPADDVANDLSCAFEHQRLYTDVAINLAPQHSNVLEISDVPCY